MGAPKNVRSQLSARRGQQHGQRQATTSTCPFDVPISKSVGITIFLILVSLPLENSQNFQPPPQQQPQLQPQQSAQQNTATLVPPPLSVIDDMQRSALAQSQQQAQVLAGSILPVPAARPNVRVNIRDWTRRIGEDIRLVSERTSCVRKIGAFFEDEGKFFQLDPIRLRDSILNQTNALLAQHKAAVNGIVMEAEKAAMAHHFIKNLTVNYTDVHRVRNKNDPPSAGNNFYFFNNNNLQEYPNDYTTNQYGPSSTTGDKPAFTSISGGTPVPGPVEWQTPVRDIEMWMNKNFGDIPVNTSMSAVHLPLPVYPGLPEIMNGIAWTERLDSIFRRNLAQFMHVHHQYYGDTLGFMRTFPAHKWRIPRNEPDLFDARIRPWYIAGAATPKDVVVLVDTSGSMTGLRREIAKGVVFEILDTLTINDHFAVLRFSETVTPVGLPKCSLKTPRFAVQLREQCRATHPSHSAGPLPGELLGSGRRGASPAEQQAECLNWRRQWEARNQYLKDHPSVAAARNGSFMFDEAYDQSIVNVTLDIKDAYLLPATSRNVRYLKSNFSMPTAGIANFTRALMAGFELLQAYNRTNELGSQCNQAIMLITDGAIKSHEDVFNRYNYPGAPIRVFTYMIGREVGDIRPTKEMACRNRGYYAHVINLSEVREQVQKYLPVMARPLVLAHQHPVTWTNAYGDETHQVLTDWVLEIKRRERARIMLNEEREHLIEANSSDVINIELTNIPEYDEIPLVDEALKNRIICEDARDDLEAMEQSLKEEIDPLGYSDLACHWAQRRADLLTSVVKPVFDLRNTSIFFDRVLSKNVWQEREIHLRNAQLLGVASVDLRVADIIRAAPSHLLGPNGYSILLGQNGFVMHHPNFHALLEDPFDKHSKILKPYFNSVDLTHIEQVYHKNESDLVRRRNDETKLLKLREAALNRSNGAESINVKRTVDCRRRPHIRSQTFYYGPIKDTPYSFMLALPDSYGLNRVSAKLPLDRDSFSFLRPSEYDLWAVHPDYRYCERVSAGGLSGRPASAALAGPESQLHLNDSLSTLIELLNATALGEPYELEYDDLSTISGSSNTNEQLKSSYRQKFLSSSAASQQQIARYICDRELFGSLLFDAKATYESFVSTSNGHNNDDGSCAQTSEEMRAKLAQIYGLEMSFVATRSGLTRTLVFDENPRIKKLAKLFIERHDRAVDESWYSRTVDWNMRFNDEATIIAVPYNAYVRLIAKLRQRITQRHPAVNDTRSNCDPSLMEDIHDGEDEAQESTGTAHDAQQMPPPSPTTIESSSGVVQIASSSSQQSDVSGLDQAQNDEPLAASGGADPTGEEQQADRRAGKGGASNGPTPVDVSAQSSEAGGGGADGQELPDAPKVNYHEYSSFDFLDLLANSSVHVTATQSVIVNKAKKQNRTAVAVTGHLYDYATFARKFLNSTSLSIKTYSDPPASQSAADFIAGQVPPPLKVDICPNGECPTKCGQRNDSIDCLLVDNNGFIVVGEELPHIGRPLVDYDEKLMQSLVNKRVFHQIILTDHQAICQDLRQNSNSSAWALSATGSGQLGSVLTAASQAQTSSGSSLFSRPLRWELAQTLLANCAQALVWTVATLYSALFLKSAQIDPADLFASESLLGRLHQWQRSAILAEAQSATANQSLLALLPNKTYLRPCEKPVVLYETRPYDPAKLHDDSPEYYVTKCGCSGWYVYDAVPKSNLIMLIVNTTVACRRCDASAAIAPVPPIAIDPLAAQAAAAASALSQANAARSLAEDQVCTMLERDAQLYVQKPSSCLAQHPDEASIHICGAGSRPRPPAPLAYISLSILMLVTLTMPAHARHKS